MINLKKLIKCIFFEFRNRSCFETIWETSDLSADFGAQTITITGYDLKDYDYFIAGFFIGDTTFDLILYPDKTAIASTCYNVHNSTRIYLYTREITVNSEDNTITFSKCGRKTSESATSCTTVATQIKPFVIYGARKAKANGQP